MPQPEQPGSDIEAGLDTYQGTAWADRAELGPLRAGLDPHDLTNRRNRHMDAVQRVALRWALRQVPSILGHRPLRLLDFGCGAGRMLGEFVDRADEVWGCDRSMSMLGAARATGVVPSERLFPWPETGAPPASLPRFDAIITVGVTLTPAMRQAVVDALPRLAGDEACYVGLEQVDSRRTLTLQAYADALRDAGFDLVRHRVVRRGTRSPALGVAGRIPASRLVTAALARAEWATAPSLGIPLHGYGDVVLIARRGPAGSHDDEATR